MFVDRFRRQILFWVQTTILGNAVSLDSHASESFQHIRTGEGGRGRTA